MSKYEYEYNENIIINLSSNSLESLRNFVKLLIFPNLLNIENFIIKIKKNKK